MDTREFLRRYAYVYLYVAAFFLGCAGLMRQAVETAGELSPLPIQPVIVIDAGHGGLDGGTTGAAGTAEDRVNLQIAGRLEAMLALLGCETVMTRTTEDSLASEGKTIRAQKQSDLRNRVNMVSGFPSALLVSIHQNHFPDPKYSGPQVFHTKNAAELAGTMQSALTAALAPGSRRSAKTASGIYLMEHIPHPGLLVECGFLSNPEEERKLASAEHQKKLAAVMGAVLAGYVRSDSLDRMPESAV